MAYGQAGPGYNQYGVQTATAPWGAEVYGTRGDSTMNKTKSATINTMDAFNPLQVQLQNMLLQNYMGGAGEFGFGAGAKQANATLSQGMANRGISQDSGVAQSAMGSALAQMLAADTARRQQYGLNLLQANPAYYNSMQMQLGKQQQGGLGDALGGLLGGVAPMLAYNWTS